jgi:hypothetical protein
MTIKNITEITNKTLPNLEPVREVMDIYIPHINVENIPKTNGFIYLAVGSGGSGKSSMLLSFFKKNVYRGKFNNIFYFCPESSFTSVKNHPFANAKPEDNVFIHHELTPQSLEEVYNFCDAKKKRYTEYQNKKKLTKSKHPNKAREGFVDEEPKEEEDEEPELEYTCLYIDDYADIFKQNQFKDILNKILIKTRHLCLAVIVTLQELKYFPLNLRKQITNMSIFKPKNYSEWTNICEEYFNLNKEDSLTLYDYVYDKPYNHLDVQTNVGSNTYYKNWNKLVFS